MTDDRTINGWQVRGIEDGDHIPPEALFDSGRVNATWLAQWLVPDLDAETAQRVGTELAVAETPRTAKATMEALERCLPQRPAAPVEKP